MNPNAFDDYYKREQPFTIMEYDFHMELLKQENLLQSMNEGGLTLRKSSMSQTETSTNDRRSREEDRFQTTASNTTDKGRDIGELLREFGRRTTAHGWGRVVNAPIRAVKVMWITFTICALSACLAQIILLTASYLSFTSEIKWQVLMTELEFPSVTVCNIQPYSMSTAQMLMSNDTSKFYQWYNVTKNLDYFRRISAALNKSKEFEWVENRMKQPIGYFENIGDEAIIVGHNGYDFIIRCGFGMQHCNTTNFTFYQNPSYYNCYTFNGGNVSRDKLISITSGPQEGLSLILYLENDNGVEIPEGTYHTLSPVGNAGGVRVVVHPVNTRPSPVDHGIDIPPGYSANIAMDVKHFMRLDYPYGDCIEPDEWSTDRFVYSTHACLALCQQFYVIEHCNCISSTLPVTLNQAKEKESGNISYCAYWNVNSPEDLVNYFQRINCEAENLMKFATTEEIKSECDCLPACSEYTYKTDMSYSYWPLEFSQEDFYKTLVLENPIRDQLKAYNNLKKLNTSQLINSGLIRKNFVRVNVFLKGMTIEEYVEKKSYEFPNLLSDVGGSFGLWIGMSFITWFEVVELVVHVTYNGCKRLLWKWDDMQHIKQPDKEKY